MSAFFHDLKIIDVRKKARGVGFEPTRPVVNGLAIRRLTGLSYPRRVCLADGRG